MTLNTLTTILILMAAPFPGSDDGSRCSMAEAEAGVPAETLWERAILEIAASPTYGGLELMPQEGLIPLGADPASGLQEFAHSSSGSVPERDPESGALVLKDDSCLVFVLLPGGTFHMGAQKKDPAGANHDSGTMGKREGPAHEVTLAPYFISKYEMTQAQWLRSAGDKPSFFLRALDTVEPRFPVEQVTWSDCARVMKAQGLSLPTEAQWEYACRAGSTTPWNTGSEGETVKRSATLDQESPTAVGRHAPNKFGLYDMHGNVWEWCQDGFLFYKDNPVRPTDGLRSTDDSPRFRIYRGGGFFNKAPMSRSSARHYGEPGAVENDVGVRPMRPIAIQ